MRTEKGNLSAIDWPNVLQAYLYSNPDEKPFICPYYSSTSSYISVETQSHHKKKVQSVTEN